MCLTFNIIFLSVCVSGTHSIRYKQNLAWIRSTDVAQQGGISGRIAGHRQERAGVAVEAELFRPSRLDN